MTKEIITFEQLPQAVSELTTQVMELRNMVSSLQPQVPTEKHRIIGIDDACIITQKAKPTIYTLARKGLIPARNSISTKMNCLNGSRKGVK